MSLLLENLRCIDPQVGLDEVTNIVIEAGRIIEVSPTAQIAQGQRRDLSGKIALPGLVDMHVHLREPGQEYKEDLASGGRAAAQGGFTDVLAMPNTNPTVSTATQVGYILEKSLEVTRTRVHVAGSLTRDLKGESLAEIGDMYHSGALAFTDDGRGVQDSGLMRLAMDYCKQFGAPVLSHCQDETVVGQGMVNEGVVSTRLGLAGWPALGEELMIAREIALAELTGCRVHIQHISTARGLELVKQAKASGIDVSCEVTPHHLFLNEDDIDVTYNSSFKINPPLRTPADNAALQAGFCSGDIDCIASDHAPHAAHEKALEFENAPFGSTGLETSLSLMIQNLVKPGLLSYAQLVQLMAVNPRRILGLEPVCLARDSAADITIIDPEWVWTAGADGWQSKSSNSAFSGQLLEGRASDVYVAGVASLENGVVY